MGTPRKIPLTVSWVLFGFRGRIGRKSFALSCLLIVLIQGAVIAQIVGAEEDSPASIFWALVLMAIWVVSAWIMIALAVKRLHDIGLPAALAALLLVPAISWIGLLFLCFVPSSQEINDHGPPPFSA